MQSPITNECQSAKVVPLSSFPRIVCVKSGQIGKLFDFRACRINEILLYQLLKTYCTVYVAVGVQKMYCLLLTYLLSHM